MTRWTGPRVVFAGLFSFGAVDLFIARIWARRSPPSSGYRPTSHAPSGDGVRIEQLNNLARLRDSGALTHEEYEAEKKGVLGGL